MSECRIQRYQRKQGSSFSVVIRLIVTGTWIVEMWYVKSDGDLTIAHKNGTGQGLNDFIDFRTPNRNTEEIPQLRNTYLTRYQTLIKGRETTTQNHRSNSVNEQKIQKKWGTAGLDQNNGHLSYFQFSVCVHCSQGPCLLDLYIKPN